ncbi:isoprenylcysteine carboxyl methyltransferase family protein [Psychromarinibacter sp. S121]|uniref:isoprenylcysteine carboxyl methyltransferase family protein n=1 Tax=Psychromarinibacter sp. S121 TaxID=3415127 RepID=UPI003C7DFF3E
MPLPVLIFVLAAIALRFASLAVSIRNEKHLKADGAVEYGARTSMALAAAHIAFYLAAIAESVWRAKPVSPVTWSGVALYVLSICALWWVIATLGRFWTVKLIIARDHALVTNPVFLKLRHPNYFLNILPELLGFALALQAWTTLVAGLPLYAILLWRRIGQEEQVMRARFAGY